MTDIPDLIANLERMRDRIKSYYTGLDQDDRDLIAIAGVIRALRATQWVPIADVPEEWKDGRPTLLWATVEEEHTFALHLAYCQGYYDGDAWVSVYVDDGDRFFQPTPCFPLPANPKGQ